jgi:hypothetical protein
MSSVEGLFVDTSVGDVGRHLVVDVCAGGLLFALLSVVPQIGSVPQFQSRIRNHSFCSFQR